MLQEHGADIAKGVPPTIVATMSVFGISIPDAVQVLTLVYVACLCVQMAYRGWRWWKTRGGS
jgi:hypothetical protein